MLAIWLLTWILVSTGFVPAMALWTWFGHHVLLTVLLLVFFA